MIGKTKKLSNFSEQDYDRSDHKSFRSVTNSSGHPVLGDRLRIASASAADAGMYFCVGQNTEGMTPGFLHLTVLERDEAILQVNIEIPHSSTKYMLLQHL